MRQKGKRKIIKTIPKKKYVQKPPHKGTFWSEYSFAIIAFFFMVFVSFLLYYSSLPENYDKETVGNIVRHELKYDMTQGRMGGSVSYSFVVYYQNIWLEENIILAKFLWVILDRISLLLKK